ncbi:hypothetical protein [Desulfonatronum parangueonense]
MTFDDQFIGASLFPPMAASPQYSRFNEAAELNCKMFLLMLMLKCRSHSMCENAACGFGHGDHYSDMDIPGFPLHQPKGGNSDAD